MTKEDLSLIATSVLIREVLARFDHAIFVGNRENDRGAATGSLRRIFKGDPHKCIGLAQHFSFAICDAFERVVTDKKVDREDGSDA